MFRGSFMSKRTRRLMLENGFEFNENGKPTYQPCVGKEGFKRDRENMARDWNNALRKAINGSTTNRK